MPRVLSCRCVCECGACVSACVSPQQHSGISLRLHRWFVILCCLFLSAPFCLRVGFECNVCFCVWGSQCLCSEPFKFVWVCGCVCVCVCAYSKVRLEVGLFLLQSLMCPCVCNWNTWVIDSLSPPSQITAPGVFECTHLEALGQSRQLWQTKACQAWTTHKHTQKHTRI